MIDNFPEDKKIDLNNPITQLLYNSEYKIHKEDVTGKLKKKFQIKALDFESLTSSNSVVNRDPERKLSNLGAYSP